MVWMPATLTITTGEDVQGPITLGNSAGGQNSVELKNTGTNTGAFQLKDDLETPTLGTVKTGTTGFVFGADVEGANKGWYENKPKPPSTTDTPTTIGSNAEGYEAEESTAFTADGTNACSIWVTSRVGYFHSGNKKLYGYARKLVFDKSGRLASITGETRYIIDTPVTS